MASPPVPPEIQAFLQEANPAVIATLRDDGSPHTVATWYLWDTGRVLVNMDGARRRLAHLRRAPRVFPRPGRRRRRVVSPRHARGASRLDRARPGARRHRSPRAPLHRQSVRDPRALARERLDRGRLMARLGRCTAVGPPGLTRADHRRARTHDSQLRSAHSSIAYFFIHPHRTRALWILQPRQSPSTDSIHISDRQIRHIVRGSAPRMPTLVITVIANAIARPSVQAKRLGFALTHSGDRCNVIARATMPN